MREVVASSGGDGGILVAQVFIVDRRSNVSNDDTAVRKRRLPGQGRKVVKSGREEDDVLGQDWKKCAVICLVFVLVEEIGEESGACV